MCVHCTCVQCIVYTKHILFLRALVALSSPHLYVWPKAIHTNAHSSCVHSTVYFTPESTGCNSICPFIPCSKFSLHDRAPMCNDHCLCFESMFSTTCCIIDYHSVAQSNTNPRPLLRIGELWWGGRRVILLSPFCLWHPWGGEGDL